MLYALFVAVFLALWAILSSLTPLAWRLLTHLASWAAALSMRHGFVQRTFRKGTFVRDYLPVLLILGLGAATLTLSAKQFVDIGELVQSESATLHDVDRNAHTWAVSSRDVGSTTFFATMSVIGGPVFLGIVVTAFVFILLVTGHRPRAFYLAGTAAVGGLLVWELKSYFGRARPAMAEMLRQAHGFSFPSGHAMGATVVFGALAYIGVRSLPGAKWRAASVAISITFIVAIALSRVYLGVHWISDVGAGITAGAVWVTLTTLAYETYRRIHRIRTGRLNANRDAGALTM